MRALLAVVLLAAPAAAQVAYPPATIDLSNVPTKADVQAATDAATAAQSVASAAQTAAASKCAATPAIPGMEVIGGVAGTTGVGCRPVNSVQPRITRSVSFTTGSAGTAAVTWTDMGAVPLVFVVPNVASGAGQAPACYPLAGTITATGATVKCYTTQSVTVALLGAVVAPITTAGAGITGQVLAIPVS
jgi:hypothetical protein